MCDVCTPETSILVSAFLKGPAVLAFHQFDYMHVGMCVAVYIQQTGSRSYQSPLDTPYCKNMKQDFFTYFLIFYTRVNIAVGNIVSDSAPVF